MGVLENPGLSRRVHNKTSWSYLLSLLVIDGDPQVLRNIQCRIYYRVQIFLELNAQASVADYSNGDALFLPP